jgi:hypothetical protein
MNVLLHSELAHFVLYFGFIALVGGMPAPTATSGIAYKWAFSSLNIFAANFARAAGPKVENSPNFQAALNIQQVGQGQPQTPVIPTPPAQSAEASTSAQSKAGK